MDKYNEEAKLLHALKKNRSLQVLVINGLVAASKTAFETATIHTVKWLSELSLRSEISPYDLCQLPNELLYEVFVNFQ